MVVEVSVVEEKRCSKCGTVTPLTGFNKRQGTKDGLQIQCKACLKKARKKYYSTLYGCLHHRWDSIRQRCENPDHTSYNRYGERGIQCLLDFDSFYTHVVYYLGFVTVEMLRGLETHRIDNDGAYIEGNIEFLMPAEHTAKHVELRKNQSPIC